MLLICCHIMPVLSFTIKPLKPVSALVSPTIQSNHIPPLYPLRLPFTPSRHSLRALFTIHISQHLSIFASLSKCSTSLLKHYLFSSDPHSQLFIISSACFAGFFPNQFSNSGILKRLFPFSVYFPPLGHLHGFNYSLPNQLLTPCELFPNP